MELFERIIAWANANEGLLQALAMLGGLLVVAASFLRRSAPGRTSSGTGVSALLSLHGVAPDRAEAVQRLLEDRGGLVGSAGTEASFPDALDAATAALEIAEQSDSSIVFALSERRLDAAPAGRGQILVTRAIQRALSGAPGIGFEASGNSDLPHSLVRAEAAPQRSRLKPALIAVGAVLILSGALLWYGGPGQGSSVRSIAVLPLENLSGDSSQDYFSDGLTDALIGELARIHSLRVISRTSVMHYKENPAPLPEIARALDIDAVVEGSVLRDGSRVRISTKLIRADTDEHLWAEDYERELQDVLTLQREVARSVAVSVRSRLTSAESDQLSQAHEVDPEALDPFLRGVRLLDQRTIPSMDEAIEEFRRAVEIDPGFADAHARLSLAVMLRTLYSGASREAMQEVEAAALRAIELDPNSSIAHVMLAQMGSSCGWNIELSSRHAARALEANPNGPIIRRFQGMLFVAEGRFAEAIREFRIAGSLDPLSRSFNVILGISFYRLRLFEEAESYFQRALEIDPEYSQALRWLGRNASVMGDPERALALLERAKATAGRPTDDGWLGFVYVQQGREDKAREALSRLEAAAREGRVREWQLARLYAALGERDAMIASLHRAYEICDVISMSADPAFDPYLDDPGFIEAIGRFNIDIENTRAIAAGKPREIAETL